MMILGGLLGVAAVFGLCWLMHALPAHRESSETFSETFSETMDRLHRERMEFNKRTRQPQVTDELRRAWSKD